jgi:GNAT superfamily N-acetyltransferase
VQWKPTGNRPDKPIAGRGRVPVASGVVASDSFPPIHRLGLGDLRRCVALSVDRGWLPERPKWSLLLGSSEAFGIDAPDGDVSGRLAGAVVLTRWGPDLASVGMMLVATRYARRGLGRALMENLLAQAGDATVTLFATDMGRPLYEKLGFVPVRQSVSFVGQFVADRSDNRKKTSRSAADAGLVTSTGSAVLSAPGTRARPGGFTRPATEADLPSILAVDEAAFGADRSRVLTRLPGFAEQMAVLEADQGIIGYAAAWRNLPSSAIIGPVVAPDAGAAKRLVADLAAKVSGTIRLDLDPDRPELPAWAHQHGLEPVSRTTVMARGELAPRGAPDRLFTPISVALA